jgi:23S rRNA pseudouridine1911/1915/1917 synthase
MDEIVLPLPMGAEPADSDAIEDESSEEGSTEESSAVSDPLDGSERQDEEAASDETFEARANRIAVSPPLKDLRFTVDEEHAGQRIDLFLTLKIDGYSRVFLRRVVMAEQVLVDGRPVKPAFRVFPGQQVTIGDLPPPPTDGPIAEDIPLDVLYEDECLVAINKPPGMVVHPAKGHWSGTLTAALAHHFTSLSDAGGPTRPGIVHRLDRETSGVILIAKTNEVHFKLCAQFEARKVQKTYVAIVSGSLDRDRDRILHAIGHHP